MIVPLLTTLMVFSNSKVEIRGTEPYDNAKSKSEEKRVNYSAKTQFHIVQEEKSSENENDDFEKEEHVSSKKCNKIVKKEQSQNAHGLDEFGQRSGKAVKTDSSPGRSSLEEESHSVNWCSECRVSFPFDKDYVKHCKERHVNVAPYSCPYCQCHFASRRNVHKHAEAIHDAPYVHYEKRRTLSLVCEICQNQFQTWKRLEQHGVVVHPGVKIIRCQQCLNAFSCRMSLLKHMKQQHTNKCECEFCKEVFQNTAAWIEHLKNCTEKKRNTRIISYKSIGRKCGSKYGKNKYVCEYCDKEIVGLKEYNKHGKKEHPGNAMYRCQTCGHNCFSRRTLLSHTYRHHRRNKFLCQVCQKCYYSTTSCLKQHERACLKKLEQMELFKREGLPVQYCFACEKEYYMLPSAFRSHVSRHDQYDYCSICDKGFDKYKNLNGLEKHYKKRHSAKDDSFEENTTEYN